MTEINAAHSEREAARLQKEFDATNVELDDWKEKYDEICRELEQTFNEMAGYWLWLPIVDRFKGLRV